MSDIQSAARAICIARSTDAGSADGAAPEQGVHHRTGRISSDHPVTVSGTTSKHKLFGKMNSGGNTLHLQSSDGSIHIMK